MRRISSFLAVLLCVQTLAAAASPAPGPETGQVSPQQSAQGEKVKAEVHKRGIGEKAKVRVPLHDRSQQKGHISRFEDTSFSIRDKKTGNPIGALENRVIRTKAKGSHRLMSADKKIAWWNPLIIVQCVVIGAGMINPR